MGYAPGRMTGKPASIDGFFKAIPVVLVVLLLWGLLHIAVY